MTTLLEAPTLDQARTDEAITADRDEIKYLVPPEHVGALLTELQQHLPVHRFTGAGANRLPDAHHYVTSVYFDTPSSAHFRAATLDPEHNVKIRAKEYYDIHPSLAELATDPAQLVRYQPWLWFELKRRVKSRTFKHRFRLPKRDVPTFFAEGRVTRDALVLEKGEPGAEGSDAGTLQAILDYCRDLGEPLSAVSLVNYRRLSWQAPTGELRVTLDLGLAFYAPPADLWTRDRALVRDKLGPVQGRETRLVLEVKRTRPIPFWLEQSLACSAVIPQTFSKFVAAERALLHHG